MAQETQEKQRCTHAGWQAGTQLPQEASDPYLRRVHREKPEKAEAEAEAEAEGSWSPLSLHIGLLMGA